MYSIFVVMIQKRVKTGKDFEISHIKDGWRLINDRPLVVWSGKGKNNIEKIKSLNFNHKDFVPTEKTKWDKSDITNINDGRKREIKKYNIKQIKCWNLYSEPFFKIARKNQANNMDKVEYNKFTSEFYYYNIEKGFFNNVVKEMTSKCEGIQIKENFFEMSCFDFRTVLSEREWRGYHRIQIEFKLKDSLVN